MSPSSLVFVAIVAGWAAYLVPQWVRRRDQLAAGRTGDRHSEAARVLAPRRRETPKDAPSSAPIHRAPARLADRPAPSAATGRTRQARSARRLSPAARAAGRRRRLLLALLLLTAAGAGLTALAAVPWWAVLPAAGLLALDVAAVVATAPSRATARRPAGASTALRPARWAPPERIGDLPLRRRDVTAHATPDAHAAPDADAGGEPLAPAVATSGTWVPVPVPPPTYTLKPVARRPAPRPLADPEAGVSAAPAEPSGTHGQQRVTEPLAAAAEAPPDLPGLDLDAVLARRRAANG